MKEWISLVGVGVVTFAVTSLLNYEPVPAIVTVALVLTAHVLVLHRRQNAE